MPPYKHVGRYRQIVGVLIDEGLDNMVDVTGLSRFAPVRSRFHRVEDTPPTTMGVRIKRTLERLGPTFVKLGQAASTRSDLIPDPIIAELRKLQDDVAPFPYELVAQTISEELGGPVEEVFLSFDSTPLASASIGQVHAATLPDGTDVVVKVQRPGVKAQVEVDVDILMTQARFVRDRTEIGEYYDVVEIVDGFAQAIIAELDYDVEGRNADRFNLMFAGDEKCRFPKVHWEYTTPRVLTLERFDGIAFNRPEALDAAGLSRADLARKGIYCYLEQIFEHGFYHADPHPGNLFALPEGCIGFTDFGRIGTISQVGRDQLADLFLAIVDNDVPLAVDTLVEAAGSPGDINIADLERDVSRLITKYYNKSLREVHIGQLISEVLALVRNHHLAMSSELAVLLATLTVLEGLGTQLDPSFDFVAVTAPFARRMADERMRPQNVFRQLGRAFRRSTHLMTDLPESLSRLLKSASRGELRMTVKPTGLEPIMTRLEEAVNRMAFALVVSAFVVGLSILLQRTNLPQTFIWVARIAMLGAVFAGSWFFISVIVAHYSRKRRI